MPDRTELSEIKRVLLEKYLRGDIPQGATAASIQRSPAPLSSTGSRAPLVVIQDRGSKRPFFFFHVHWQGGAFYCFNLARDLGPDQPFYVLDPYNFDGLPVPPTLETMAAAYIESIRVIQPEGPYFLGGFCGGGLIAYEVAQQLRTQGQAVDLLALVEPWAGPIQLIRLVGSYIRLIGNLIRLSLDKQLDWFLRLRYIYIYRFQLPSQDKHSQGFSLFPSAKSLRRDWMGIFIWSVSEYIPRHYPGKVTYFWTSEKSGARRLWWGKVAKTEDKKGIEVHVIPGQHMTLVTEHLPVLAKHLSGCLTRVQATASSRKTGKTGYVYSDTFE